MQDGDHDALNFPVLGDASALPSSLDPGSNKLLVAATLAALFIAGSAIVYRTIPLSSSRAASSSISGHDDAVHKQKKMKLSEPLQAAQKRPERDEGDPGAISYEPRSDANGSLLTPASPARTTEDFDSKESKSSRSKDRRRRGKDPIKEMLKSEKRSRGLGAASPTLSNRDYTTFIKSPAAKDDPSPSSPSTSLFTDSQLTRVHDSGKNAKSKPTGQREKSNIGPDDTISDRSQQARGNSLGTISGMHSRATSESISASESTQRQNILDHLQGHTVSAQLLPSSDYPSTSDPASSLASDDGLGRPQSSMSASTTSSAGSRQVGNLDDHDDLVEWETIRREKSNNKRRQASLSQARPSRSGLASDDEDTRQHQVAVGDSSSVSPHPILRPMESTSRTTTTSVSAATEMTTVTGPASPSSSAFFSSGATSSPSLSHEGGEPRDKFDPTSSSSHSMASSSDTPKSPASTDKSRKGSQQTGSSSVASSDPWDWDGAGNVPSSSSSSNVGEGDRNPAKEKHAEKGQTKERDIHQKPPRLQQAGVAAGKAPSFSSVAASRLPASSTHPTSLYSPTSSSFGQSSGSGISASISSAPVHGGGSAHLTSSSSAGEVPFSLGEVKERDDEEEEEAFIFPTLNPTTAVAGSSRTRSSLVDNNINNSSNSNTTHYNSSSTSRRAPTPRRPLTPARSNGTPPPPHPSSSSPHPHGSSSSLNSPTSHPGSANGNSIPALSTQTQLASLRGALEAARLREEKNKQEMETYTKEMEALRWENVNWRRGQQDLQMQIRHLTHQLQSYASLVASISPQVQQQQTNGTGPSANPAAPGSTSPPSTAPNGYGSAPSGSTSVPATPQSSSAPASAPFTQQQQQQQAQQTPVTHPTPPPLHMQMLSNLQMNGLSSPTTGVLSPLSMATPPLLMGIPHGASPSGFYPYPMPPHPHPPPHPYMIHAQQVQYMQQQYQQQQQQQQQPQQPLSPGSAQPAPHQANVFSSIFPPGPVPPPLMSPHQQHQYSAYVASQQAAAAAAAAAAVSAAGAGSTSSAVPIPYGSRSSSVAGTSSAGSMSPDITGSPSPGGGVNGTRRARTRTLTANDGRMVWEDAGGAGEGWIGADDGGDGDDGDGGGRDESPEGGEGGRVVGGGGGEDEYSEGGFNEVLVDAILKRPGSIRVRSTSRRGKSSLDSEGGMGDNDEDPNSQAAAAAAAVVVGAKKERVEVVEQLTEFTFPSLSNIGNVIYRSDVVAVNGGLSSSSSSSSASPVPPLAMDDDVVVVTSDIDPAGMDVALSDPSDAGLVESIPESVSVMTEETMPREELLASVVAEPLTKMTEPEPEPLSEDDPRQSQEDAEQTTTNSSLVEH